MENDDTREIRQRFQMVCRVCGREEVVVDFDPGQAYSEYTVDPPSFTIGCNHCKENDFRLG